MSIEKGLLNIISEAPKPVVSFLLNRGWDWRLKRSKSNKFRKLNRGEKKSVKKFWNSYGKKVSSDWCAYFSYGNGIVDPRYLPIGLYRSEIGSKLGLPYIDDKNMYNIIYNTKQPKTIARVQNGDFQSESYNIISLDDVVKRCRESKNVIVKISRGSSCGKGIFFWDDKKTDKDLIALLQEHKNLIIQEVVKQHEFLSSIHPESLNTLRIVTLMIDGKVVLLRSLLRMGRNSSKVDNFSAGGVICAIDENGFFHDKAVQSNQEVLDRHPSGFVFSGKRIPSFDKVVNDAKRLHEKMSQFKIVHWDYSISEEGEPILIETNLPLGQMDMHQLNTGPFFGEYTERVLDYIYKGKPL